MFTNNKVTEIFFMADEFCKFFHTMMAKYTIRNPKKRKYHRESTMSKAEVMPIIILFHNSGNRCLKHFYLETINDEFKNIAQVELHGTEPLTTL